MTSEELMDLYPEGRTFYDETDDPGGFVAACHDLGLTTTTHQPPPSDDLGPWVTVYVPPEKLYDFYELNLRVGT